MLAGRKLLLADDSVTIQKVIDLTFADEGVRVITFGNGQDAIEHLEEIAPDVVLADVFMPSKNGYEVCKYVKENEKLKHIPVMLLVGSFEPFDEAEARRVGADDILTKPFQSIRRLIDRVGALVGSPPRELEVPTAELPNPEKPAEVPMLNTQDLEISTADTLRLPDNLELGEKTLEPAPGIKSVSGEEKMDTVAAELRDDSRGESSDVLLDLGEFELVQAVSSDDFVLELDPADTLGGQVPKPAVFEQASLKAFVEPQVTETVASVAAHDFSYQPQRVEAPFQDTQHIAYEDQVHELPVSTVSSAFETTQPGSPEVGTPGSPAASVAPAFGVVPDKLSPEMIDAIARRAVEMLSEKVVREIAWEVVPDLAELLIKRQLELKESQTK